MKVKNASLILPIGITTMSQRNYGASPPLRKFGASREELPPIWLELAFEASMLISSYAQALPWCNGNLNIEKIKYGLQNEGYYLVGDSIKGTDDGMAWKMFKELRNYIIAKEATSTDSLVTLLKKTTSLIQDNAMPDGYNQERPDNGGHDHGDPGPGDWHGGIGNFGPDGGRGH